MVEVSFTMVDDTALKIPMVIQMKGNTMGGGIQSGRSLSLFASFSSSGLGRRAFNTENVLFFTARGKGSYRKGKWEQAV